MNGFKFLNLCVLSLSLGLNASSDPSFRLVVTGGLLGVHSGSEAFFDSPIFRLGAKSPLKITNTLFKAYAVNQTVFWAKDGLEAHEILSALKNGAAQQKEIWEGSEFFGVVPTQQGNLKRELGAVSKKVWHETRVIDGKLVFAVDLSENQKGVYWPKKSEELRKVAAVSGQDKNGNVYFFFPREFRATATAFQVVDQLLKKPDSRYVDLGNALSRPDHESAEMAAEMSKLLQQRTPAALALGRYDLGVLLDIPQNSPYIGALKGDGAPPVSRRVRIGSQEIRFLALGEISEVASGFLGPKMDFLTTRQSIEQIQFQQDDLVIGLSENAASGAKAIEYPVLDLVLSLSYVRGGSLPAEDDINLLGNEQSGVRTVAPLVRIAPSDVTEVSVWMDTPGQIRRVLIKRYPIVGGISTREDFPKQALDSKSWSQKSFEDLLANILLQRYPKSELVLMEKRAPVTPIDSALPEPLAENLIAPTGRVVEISLGGAFLKQLLKAIKADQLDIEISVTNTLTRPIDESETYKVLATEKVLASVSDFVAVQMLSSGSTNPSATLQTALSESNKDAMKFLTELRKRENRSTGEIQDRYDLLKISPSVRRVVRDALNDKISLERRPERNVLVFDISDFDFGMKGNWVNDTLSGWQIEAKDPSGKAAFDENRFWDPKFLNYLFYTKMGLYYLMPKLEMGLVGSIKYYQQDAVAFDSNDPSFKKDQNKYIQSLRPGKDSVKLEAEALVPTKWYVSPLFRLTYETQLWPNPILTNLPQELWPRRVHDLRLFMGGSAKPWWGYELFRVGALLGYDFSRDTPNQSFGYGFEFGGLYKYNWRYFGFRVESNLRKLFPIVSDPAIGRMGLIWLTDARVEVPIIAGFSLSALTGVTVGERMVQSGNLGAGVVFGLALSYGNRFKWLL